MPGQRSTETEKEFLNVLDLETKERFYDDYVGRVSKYATLSYIGKSLLNKSDSLYNTLPIRRHMCK